MKCLLVLSSIVIASFAGTAAAQESGESPSRPNVLWITADDLNQDSLGCYGSQVAAITPRLDALASAGIRFERAHATSATCMPSRAAWMTGRYPHRSGVTHFVPVDDGVPLLPVLLREAGYRTGILGKVSHLRPVERFSWDERIANQDLVKGRSPERFAECTRAFLKATVKAEQPFFLLVNSHDPHRPFAGSEGKARRRFPRATRKLSPDEIEVPGFLPDLPGIRTELAQYFSSVDRLDHTVGAVLDVLGEEGLADDTVVIFSSDHGMSFPFAKANCYLASTRIPLIIRWPGVVEAGRVEERGYVNGIDLMPTVLDIAGVATPPGVDGRSIAAVLRGEAELDRDRLFTVFDETSGGRQSFPMRAVHHDGYGYIFNAWADGTTEMFGESVTGISFRAMEAVEGDEALARRVALYRYRKPEELFCFDEDPSGLRDLIGDPDHAERLQAMRDMLREHLEATGDPLLEAVRTRMGG